jgi:hypothetical protein
MKNHLIKVFSLVFVTALSGCGDEIVEIEADVVTEELESCFNDANCDGVTEYFDELLGYCQQGSHFGNQGINWDCEWTTGWLGNIFSVPGCGYSGEYITGCEMRADPSNTMFGRDCFPVIQEKIQTCE